MPTTPTHRRSTSSAILQGQRMYGAKETMRMTPFDRAGEFSSGYIAQPSPSSQAKARYWKTAFGLQAVDGLAPSEYVHELANSHTRGDISIAEVTRELNS